MSLKKRIRDRAVRLIPNRTLARIRFRDEIRMLEGGLAAGGNPSVLLFTTHKCASTLTNRILAYICTKYLDLKHLDFVGYYYLTEAEDTHELITRNRSAIFRPSGILYAPFRKYVPIPEIDRYRIVLILRDPRDVLTSLYFSTAFSHAVPLNPERSRKQRRRRRATQVLSIDEFVIRRKDEYAERYGSYLRMHRNHDVLFLRYERMITAFDSWLSDLAQGLGVALSDEDASHLRAMSGTDDVKVEDKYRHVRKATPGDYRSKLQKETITTLDAAFEDVLKAFDF